MSAPKQRNLNVSNSLSFTRMVLAAPAAWAVFTGRGELAIGLSIVGMITDVLDGYFARRFHEVTELGKVIDPIADKVYITAVVVALVMRGEMPLWYAAIVVGRDAVIFTAGLYLKTARGIVLMSNAMGKAAVVVLGLFLLGLVGVGVWPTEGILLWWMFATLVMMGASLIVYAARMSRALSKGSQ